MSNEKSAQRVKERMRSILESRDFFKDSERCLELLSDSKRVENLLKDLISISFICKLQGSKKEADEVLAVATLIACQEESYTSFKKNMESLMKTDAERN